MDKKIWKRIICNKRKSVKDVEVIFCCCKILHFHLTWMCCKNIYMYFFRNISSSYAKRTRKNFFGIHFFNNILISSITLKAQTNNDDGRFSNGDYARFDQFLAQMAIKYRHLHARSFDKDSLPEIETEKFCSICQVTQMEDFKRLICDHHFHKSCINRWLAIKRQCPYCRYWFEHSKQYTNQKMFDRRVCWWLCCNKITWLRW